MRYVSLLEQASKLKEGALDQSILTDIFKLLSNLALSSELRDGSITEKLVTVLECAKSGIGVAVDMNDYRKKVFDFVTAAMERYTVLPVSSHHVWNTECITVYSLELNTVEPAINDPPRRGHNTNNLSTKDTIQDPNACSFPIVLIHYDNLSLKDKMTRCSN